MEYFAHITDFKEAKLIYRRLAMLNHPDMGGDPQVMTNINLEFESLTKRLLKKTVEFQELSVGDCVTINGSKSKVVLVTRNTFTAVSEYTMRRATFYKSTGICVTNPRYKAEVHRIIKNGR